MSVYLDAAKIVEEKARQHPAVLVAYSGGKDSMAVMDLCCRAFQRVVGFHMALIPGLKFAEQILDDARQRWGVTILTYPYPYTFRCLVEGFYCFPRPEYKDIAKLRDWEVAKQAMQDTGIKCVAAGMKEADGLWRKHILVSNMKKYPFIFNPIVKWTKWDVLSYLASQQIPLPDMRDTKRSINQDNSKAFILWLADNHPEDFQRFCRFFPFAEAQVKRREWYGEVAG